MLTNGRLDGVWMPTILHGYDVQYVSILCDMVGWATCAVERHVRLSDVCGELLVTWFAVERVGVPRSG